MMHWFPPLISTLSAPDLAFVLLVMVANLLVARFGMWPYSLITFPGTLAHELGHWFIAKLFWARPTLPSIWPRRHGDIWVMGSVQFAPTIINAIPVALAPLLLLPLGLVFAARVMHPAYGLDYVTYGWIAGNMLFACLPSGQDWKVAAPALIVLSMLAGLFFYFT